MFPAGGLEPCLFCTGGFNLYLHLTQGFHLRNTKAWYPRLADLYSHFQDFHFFFFLNAQNMMACYCVCSVSLIELI